MTETAVIKTPMLSEVFSVPAISGEGEIALRRVLRQKILTLEAEMFKLDGHVTEIVTKHHFVGGIYAREVFIPQGMFLVAKIHNTEHLSIISKGDVSVLSEFGPERYVAPVTFVSKRWTKRVVYAWEDTIWTVFHKTDKLDPLEVEQEVIAKNYDELIALENEQLKELQWHG